MNRPTARQLQILRIVHDYTETRGVPPTLREIAAVIETGFRNVHQHLFYLGKKGLLDLSPTKSRAIRITDQGREALGLDTESTLDRLGRAVAGNLGMRFIPIRDLQPASPRVRTLDPAQKVAPAPGPAGVSTPVSGAGVSYSYATRSTR